MVDLCRRCEHFPVHHAQKRYYGPKQLCSWALMGYDCTRYPLWGRWT